MSFLAMAGSQLGAKEVVVIHDEGLPSEVRRTMLALTKPDHALFDYDAQVWEGDVVEEADPRGGVMRRVLGPVEHHPGPPQVAHLTAKWVKEAPPRVAAVRRLTVEGLHPAVISAAGDLFADGHHAAAVSEAFKSVDHRVREMTGLTASGTPLMDQAFSPKAAKLDVSTQPGRSGQDEQEGFHFLFRGAMLGIRNPAAHEPHRDEEPQEALELLGFASVLHRRLDIAEAKS